MKIKKSWTISKKGETRSDIAKRFRFGRSKNSISALLSKENREKARISNTGKKRSKEECERIRLYWLKKANWLRCEYCSKEFRRPKSLVRKHAFCSKSCNSKWMKFVRKEEDLLGKIKKIPDTKPEFESDDYDLGRASMKKDILEALLNNRKNNEHTIAKNKGE